MIADVFVLAAGFGTRLRPLTTDRPKPLVPMCGVPMLAYSLVAAKRAGAKSVIVNAHHLSEQLLRYNGVHEGLQVEVVVEPEILGTGGGLKNVLSSLDDVVLILNADILHDVNLSALREAVVPGGAAMGVRSFEQAQTYGVVAVDEEAIVVDLVSLATAEPRGEVTTDTHFTGVHAMHKSAIELIPDGFACVVRTAYVQLVPKRLVSGLRHEGFWLDCGNPSAYLDANLAVLRGEYNTALDPFERCTSEPVAATLIKKNWIGEGAVVPDSATLTECIIGEGAVVPEGAVWSSVVAWDNTTAHTLELHRSIVHDSGILAVE